MPVLERIFGAGYHNNLPIHYHARKLIIDGFEEPKRDRFGETLCCPRDQLNGIREDPAANTVFRCSHSREIEMLKNAYLSAQGERLQPDQLGAAHKRHGTNPCGQDFHYLDRVLIRKLD
jgi:hypothetical protein